MHRKKKAEAAQMIYVKPKTLRINGYAYLPNPSAGQDMTQGQF